MPPERLSEEELARVRAGYRSPRQLGTCDHETPEKCHLCEGVESELPARLLSHIDWLSARLVEAERERDELREALSPERPAPVPPKKRLHFRAALSSPAEPGSESESG